MNQAYFMLKKNENRLYKLIRLKQQSRVEQSQELR